MTIKPISMPTAEIIRKFMNIIFLMSASSAPHIRRAIISEHLEFIHDHVNTPEFIRISRPISNIAMMITILPDVKRLPFPAILDISSVLILVSGFFPVISDFMLSVTEGVLSLLSIISVSPENRTVLPLSLSDCNMKSLSLPPYMLILLTV